MNRKETMLMTIVGMTVLTTITTMSSPTQALALGHWNTDADYTVNGGLAEDSSGTSDNPNGDDEVNEEDGTTAVSTDDNDKEDSSGTSDNPNGDEGNAEDSTAIVTTDDNDKEEGSETDSNEDASAASTDDDDEDGNGMTKDVSTDDTEEDEDDEDEDDEEDEE